MSDYFDTRLIQCNTNKGKSILCTKFIPSNTIILKETPLTCLMNEIDHDMSEVIYDIVRDPVLLDEFMKLFPHDINIKELAELKANIRTEINKIKNSPLKKIHKIYKYLLSHFTMEFIVLLCLKYSCNGFQHNTKPIILIKGALFNHSCNPNVIFRFDGKQMIFTTIKNINKGEEVYDSYVDITKPKKSRVEKLSYQYGFMCACDKCEKST